MHYRLPIRTLPGWPPWDATVGCVCAGLTAENAEARGGGSKRQDPFFSEAAEQMPHDRNTIAPLPRPLRCLYVRRDRHRILPGTSRHCAGERQLVALEWPGYRREHAQGPLAGSI